jgi:hypothetical protein
MQILCEQIRLRRAENTRVGASAMTKSARKKLVLFPMSGFEDRLKEYAEKNDILLVSMEDLYG